MLSEKSLEFIRGAAMKFGASKVVLFGSCKENTEREAGDIDIAVAGLKKSDYWLFWRSLLWVEELNGKSVDVVRIEDDSFLIPMILEEGMEIYAERKPQTSDLEYI